MADCVLSLLKVATYSILPQAQCTLYAFALGTGQFAIFGEWMHPLADLIVAYSCYLHTDREQY